MISHKHKFLFIAIPKTASGTVRRLFKDLYDIHAVVGSHHTYYHHRRASYMQTHFDEKNWNWDEYFKFVFVRNPWAREVSRWKYLSTRPRLRKYTDCSFADYMNVKRDHTLFSSERYVDFYCDKNGNQLVDFIGKVENLQQDINTICDKIGIPHRKLPCKRTHKTKHKHYTEYYDDETKQIVAEKYAKDIEYFGYKFGE